MANEGIRVGLIGAGRNTRDRHIPGFHQVDGVEIVSVANRSRESGRVVADQFNIPRSTTVGASCWKTRPSTRSASAPGPICTAR